MKLVVTIDTEEDNWANYSPIDNSVENIKHLNELQAIFDQYGVKPTYLVTYPVVTNPQSVDILKGILEKGKCEIGMHCHPWNTPPFEGRGTISKQDTMLCNLNPVVVHKKLSHLHEIIQKNFKITPTSFRAGRYGFGPAVANSLLKLGYRIDSSVTPFVSWEKYYGPDFSAFYPHHFRFSVQGLDHKDENGQLLEIPATIGFLQSNFAAANRKMKKLERPFARKLHIAGILERLGLLNKTWLSPEMSSVNDMIKLAERMQKNMYSVLNFTFHSTSLKVGSSPFVKKDIDKRKFYWKIETFLKYSVNSGWQCKTLKDLEECIKT